MFLLILLLLFVGIPAVEIATFIQVGTKIGVFNTVFFTFFTAALGVVLVRWQSLQTLDELRAALNAGRPPAVELISGSLLLLAGLLLLIPGFVTDAIGFLLLVPPLRRLVALFILKRLAAGAEMAEMRVHRSPGGTIIEAEVVEVWEEGPDAPKDHDTGMPPRQLDSDRDGSPRPHRGDTPWRRP